VEQFPIRRVRRRAVLVFFALALAVAALAAHPVLHVARTAVRERALVPVAPAWATGGVEDASRLESAPVRRIVRLPEDEDAAVESLRRVLASARADGSSVSVAGARHSMGGQTFTRDGIVVDMLPLHRMTLDESRGQLHVQAGARWEEIIPFLDARGLAVSVMQSDSPFTVGGSLSVNCHGWQNDRPPIASTVESFHLLLADGRVVRCSRRENAELFAAALGGYGLFGIILDADLRVVPNARYRVEHQLVASAGYEHALDEAVRQRPIGLAYGRLNVTRERFLERAILTTFARRSDAPPGEPIVEPAAWVAGLERWIFRGSEGSEYGKELRWTLEANLAPWLFSRTTHRNQVLQGRVQLYENRDPARTDVLHEYFVPRGRVEEFLGRVRTSIPAHGADLLNVTMRDVRRDDDTLLRYADADMMALVFFFSQPRTAEADAAMEELTRDLVEASLAVGGRYYLPYRLHATREQFERAYPMHAAFFGLKRTVDPGAVFQNQFYAAYGSQGSKGPSR
jgi:FAD/FMN-containing dehydrogenase